MTHETTHQPAMVHEHESGTIPRFWQLLAMLHLHQPQSMHNAWQLKIMGPYLLLIISSNHMPLCRIHTMMRPLASLVVSLL